MVVDDSAFMRKLIGEILSKQSDIDVVQTARNGADALEKLEQFEVDVITLDVEMPILGGLETLQQIMATRPIPVVMLSSVTKRGSDITMKALSYGAVDFLPKPSGAISLDLDTIGDALVNKVRGAYQAKLMKPQVQVHLDKTHLDKPYSSSPSFAGASNLVIVIGSSTGGPRALEQVFLALPADLRAGIVVIQHMPKGFTRSFAERLNTLSHVYVKEAENGDRIENGKALIAPGNFHMEVDNGKRIRLNQNPPVQFLRPNIDVTMLCLPPLFGKRMIGVILTGMGRDGATGMAAIKQAGGLAIAQDKASSTIYSMPRVIFEEGLADYVLPIDRIGESIVKLTNRF